MYIERYEVEKAIKALAGLTGTEPLSDRTVVYRALEAKNAAAAGECRNTSACALCAVSGVTCELVNELAAPPHDGLAQVDVKIEKISRTNPGLAI